MSGKYILISAFPHDPIVPRGGAKDLFNLLKKAGSMFNYNGKIVDMK
ncbi:MAG: hypothetical protein WA461_12950 [Nitrososphaeraceae archaeon]